MRRLALRARKSPPVGRAFSRIRALQRGEITVRSVEAALLDEAARPGSSDRLLHVATDLADPRMATGLLIEGATLEFLPLPEPDDVPQTSERRSSATFECAKADIEHPTGRWCILERGRRSRRSS